jgi:hypothetical protein
LTLIELVTGPRVDDRAFVKLFENPLLNAAVEQVWDDTNILLKNGITLTGKSLTRLRWDLDQTLHERVSALKIADKQSENKKAPTDSEDIEFLHLFEEATELGYLSHPVLDRLKQAFLQSAASLLCKIDKRLFYSKLQDFYR